MAEEKKVDKKAAAKAAAAKAAAAKAAKEEERPKVDFDKFPEVRKIKASFPDAIEEMDYFREELSLRIKKERIVEVCKLLRDDPELAYDYLEDIAGVHYPKREKSFEVVYHIYSVSHRKRIRLKVSLGENEEVESVSCVWPSANWFEREAYDMVGIRFANHPDLRRILLPEDWEGHPLRKDYPLEGPPGYREKWLREHLPYYNKL